MKKSKVVRIELINESVQSLLEQEYVPHHTFSVAVTPPFTFPTTPRLANQAVIFG